MQIQHKINSNASSCYSAIIYKYVHWRRAAKTTWKINQITFFRMKKEKKGVRMRAKERAILLLKSLVHKWLIIRCGRCCCCSLSLHLWKARAAVDMIYGMLHSMYTRNFFFLEFHQRLSTKPFMKCEHCYKNRIWNEQRPLTSPTHIFSYALSCNSSRTVIKFDAFTEFV